MNQLTKLYNDNYLKKKKDADSIETLKKEKFVEILNYIPLKYISPKRKKF